MRYMSVLANQWQRSQAWIVVSFLLGGFCVYLLLSNVAQTKKMTVRLIPQEYDMVHGPVDVDRTATSSATYLTLIALADVKNYTDWTPRTVQNVTGRFVNRMTPSLYAVQGNQAMLAAEERAKGERSQSFYVEATSVKDEQVKITGILRIWQGQVEVSSDRTEYTLTYSSSDGVPKIQGFSARRVTR